MQELKVQGRLLLGLLVALSTAAPLACGDDDSKGTSPGDNAGGSAETAGSSAHAGGAGSAHGGGAGTSGSTNGGAGGSSGEVANGGASVAGDSMGGAAGAVDNGMAGEAGMAGAGGSVDVAAQYQARVDAICTVEATLNCSQTGIPADDKQTCLDMFANVKDFAPNCLPEITGLVACLAPEPAASYVCNDTSAFPKDNVCADANAALNTCFAQ